MNKIEATLITIKPNIKLVELIFNCSKSTAHRVLLEVKRKHREPHDFSMLDFCEIKHLNTSSVWRKIEKHI